VKVVGKKIDLTGRRFGRLVVIEDSGERTKNGRIKWLCECDCGNFTKSDSQALRSRESKSCGCIQKEKAFINQKTMNKKYQESYRKEGTSLLNLEQKVQKISKTGIKGVYWRKDGYVANITIKNQPMYLGFYKNKQDAINAREEAEDKYFKPILEKYANQGVE